MTTPTFDIGEDSTATFAAQSWLVNKTDTGTEVAEADVDTAAGAVWFNAVDEALTQINEVFQGSRDIDALDVIGALTVGSLTVDGGTFEVSNTSGAASVTIDGSTGNNASVVFEENNAAVWTWRYDATANVMELYNDGLTANALEFADADSAATFAAGATFGGNLVSDTDSTDDLGTTGVRWANLFVDDITVTTGITTGGTITSGGNVVSDTDSTDDLGTTGVRWANLFVDDVTVTTSLAIANTSGTASTFGDDLVIGNTSASSAGLTIFADATSGACRMFFGDGNDADVGSIQYFHSSDTWQMAAGATSVLSFSTSVATFNVPDLNIGNNGNSSTYIDIIADAAGVGGVRFGDDDDGDVGGVLYFHTSNYMQLTVNATAALLAYSDRLVISNTNNEIEMGAGGPTITTGSGAPSAGEPNGSIYLRDDGTGPNLYVRENGAWVSK